MNKHLDRPAPVNSITGKTIHEMSWEEIHSLQGEPISQRELIQKIKDLRKKR